MPDVFTKSKRSAVMSRIRGAGNKDTELRLIVLMRAAGVRGWRRGVTIRLKVEGGKLKVGKTLRAKPDFVFRKHRLAVFVDGCFWHGCPKHATWPKHNAAFWRKKILGNQARDRAQDRLLRKNQWRVIRVWEHALSTKNARRTIARVKNALLATRSRVLPGKTLARAHRGPVGPRWGWRVLRIWEHGLNPTNSGRTVQRVRRAITGRQR